LVYEIFKLLPLYYSHKNYPQKAEGVRVVMNFTFLIIMQYFCAANFLIVVDIVNAVYVILIIIRIYKFYTSHRHRFIRCYSYNCF